MEHIFTHTHTQFFPSKFHYGISKCHIKDGDESSWYILDKGGQSHQNHQLVCHGVSDDVRTNECMSTEGQGAFGETHFFCTGSLPWLRFGSRERLGLDNSVYKSLA